MSLNELSKITPRIFISTCSTAKDYNKMKSKGITHILSIYPQAKEIQQSHELIVSDLEQKFPVNTGIQYKTITNLIDVYEPKQVEVFHNSISECNKFIHEALMSSENSKILIHCQVGISRSVSLATIYFMTVFHSIDKAVKKEENLEQIETETAIKHSSPGHIHWLIKKKRRYANTKFMGALCDYSNSDKIEEENIKNLQVDLDFAKNLYKSLCD